MAVSYFQPAIVLKFGQATKTTRNFLFTSAFGQLKNIQDDSYESYFVSRTDREAAEHLFYLAGGLKSQILGEDQILTQIKDALNLAREHFTTDSTLEVLFRMAVTAGKKIKTEAPLAHGNPSVIHQAVSHLKEQGYDMHGKSAW